MKELIAQMQSMKLSPEKEQSLLRIAQKFMEMNEANAATIATFADCMLVAQNSAVRTV